MFLNDCITHRSPLNAIPHGDIDAGGKAAVIQSIVLLDSPTPTPSGELRGIVCRQDSRFGTHSTGASLRYDISKAPLLTEWNPSSSR